METRKIEFTEEQMKNLAIFLQRVQMSGAEVPAYLAIINKINQPVIDMIKNNEKNNAKIEEIKEEQPEETNTETK